MTVSTSTPRRNGSRAPPMPEPVPPAAQPPDDTAAIAVGTQPEVAGGLGAITSTMAHLRIGGLVRGARALVAMNQRDGFDCPGCAWPEAGSDRALTEFCENGAKAAAWEVTTRRADAA